MKVTFPHMGNLYITCKAVFEGFGLDVVVPPPITKKTLDLGTMYSPESACLPLKINLGNFLEAVELGADTIVMGGGVGPCRFGYYAEIQKGILKDLGINCEMIVIEPPDSNFNEVWNRITRLIKSSWAKAIKSLYLAWHKTYAVDFVEAEIHKLRAIEKRQGKSDEVFKHYIGCIERANSRAEINKVLHQTKMELLQIPAIQNKPKIRVAVIGEIYTILEPYVNHDIEKILGRLGVEVYRPIFLSQWINDHLLGGILPIISSKSAKRLAAPYLNHFVGGHGRETVGYAIELKDKVDGMVQIAPLTCMPEIVAQSLLIKISEDFGIPIMTIYVDEQTAEAGIKTRLEAFTDMLYRRKYHMRSEAKIKCMGI